MKRIISIILILVFLVLCVSCSESEKEPEPSGEGSDPENGVPEINRPEISIVYSDTIAANVDFGLANGDGYYQVIDRMWNLAEQLEKREFDKNIVYIDYASATRVYLCQDPSCNHDTENCSSFIRSSDPVSVISLGDRLVCIRSVTGELVKSQDDLVAVFSMDQQGRDRKALLSLKATENVCSPLVVASDGKILYLQVQEITEEKTTKKKLYHVDVESGETGVETEIPVNYVLQSAYDDCLLFLDYINNLNVAYSVTDKSFENKAAGVAGTYCGSKTADIRYDVDISGDYTKIKEAQSITVIVTDLKDGAQKEYGPFALEEDHAGVSIDSFYDDHVRVQYVSHLNSSDEGIVTYTLDLNTGDFRKDQLYISSRTGRYMSTVIADTGDRYLVTADSRQGKRTIYDRSGVGHTEVTDVAGYALIDKEAFYNSSREFTLINDKVYTITE